jgi:acetylornithine/succinyldiaminopimelate/putrescine aminotransferase
MKFDEIVQLEKQFLIPTYERMPILAVRGEGCYLYDDQGRKYLDFLGGLAVNSLGYAHPEVLAVLRDALAHFQFAVPPLPRTTGQETHLAGET